MSCDKTQICKNYPKCEQDAYPYPKCCWGFRLKMKAYFEDEEPKDEIVTDFCLTHWQDKLLESNNHFTTAIIGVKNAGMSLSMLKMCTACKRNREMKNDD